MEKEVGDRLDLRAGLGMGLTLIEKKFLSESFDGSGFSYDLLLGFSIRGDGELEYFSGLQVLHNCCT